MKVMLCSLVLNEIQWIEKNYEQHREFPGIVGWPFVESADRRYAATTPNMVTSAGLSVDGTTEFLRELVTRDSLVRYIPHGFSGDPADPAQGKCEARSMYLLAAEDVRPDWLVVLDGDEFHGVGDQHKIFDLLCEMPDDVDAVLLRQRHIWRPPSIASEPLFQYEVVGGYWDIPHTRIWRWYPGMRYVRNHNWPQVEGRFLNEKMKRFAPDWPVNVHLGFASNLDDRLATHAYYRARGEGRKDGRAKYVECRAAWENWKPGDVLPQGAKVVPYDGSIPEVFR